MSEKAEKKPDAAAAPSEEAGKKSKGGGMMANTPVLVGGVMLLEAIVLIGGFKFLGGSPKRAGAAETAGATLEGGKEGGAAPAEDKKKSLEVPVVDFRAPNKRSGHTYLYDVAIVVVVKAASGDQVKKIVSERDNLIRDHIRTIIAESDPEKLNGGAEPGLETLRRQIKYQLDEIIGDGLIDAVLVPKCTQLPDF